MSKLWLKYALQMAVITAVFVLIFFLVVYSIPGIGVFDNMKYWDFWIPGVYLYITIKFFKYRFRGGKMTFREGFLIGFLTTFIASMIVFVVVGVFLSMVSPAYLETSKEIIQQQAVDNMKADSVSSNSPTEDVLKHVENVKEISSQATAWSIALEKAFLTTFNGILFSLLFAVTLRKRKSNEAI